MITKLISNFERIILLKRLKNIMEKVSISENQDFGIFLLKAKKMRFYSILTMINGFEKLLKFKSRFFLIETYKIKKKIINYLSEISDILSIPGVVVIRKRNNLKIEKALLCESNFVKDISSDISYPNKEIINLNNEKIAVIRSEDIKRISIQLSLRLAGPNFIVILSSKDEEDEYIEALSNVIPSIVLNTNFHRTNLFVPFILNRNKEKENIDIGINGKILTFNTKKLVKLREHSLFNLHDEVFEKIFDI